MLELKVQGTHKNVSVTHKWVTSTTQCLGNSDSLLDPRIFSVATNKPTHWPIFQTLGFCPLSRLVMMSPWQPATTAVRLIGCPSTRDPRTHCFQMFN